MSNKKVYGHISNVETGEVLATVRPFSVNIGNCNSYVPFLTKFLDFAVKQSLQHSKVSFEIFLVDEHRQLEFDLF